MSIRKSFGYTLPKECAPCVDYLEKMATRNSGEAMLELGRFYENGICVAPNVTRATALYRQAATNGEREALVDLGLLLERTETLQDARELFEEAAKAGCPSAGYYLSKMIRHGSNVMSNAESINWMRQSAGLGHVFALVKLARLAFNGHVPDGRIAASMYLMRAFLSMLKSVWFDRRNEYERIPELRR